MKSVPTILLEFIKEILYLYYEMTPYLLLGMLIAGILSVVMKPTWIARHLGGRNVLSIVKSALFGVPLPLCSCSVVPTTQYLVRSGASKPAAMSFLVATPQTGVDSIVATYGLLGPFWAIYRPIVAFFSGLLSGILNKIFFKERPLAEHSHTENEAYASDESEGECSHCEVDLKPIPKTTKEKIKEAYHYTVVEFLDEMYLRFLLGIVLAAAISYFIPDDFVNDSILANKFVAMIFMLIIGLPLYICSTTSIPVALALLAKGLSPGSIYVFLVAGPATNIASLLILGKLFGKKETIVLTFSVIVFALLGGWGLDAFDTLNIVDLTPPASSIHTQPLWEKMLKIVGMIIFSIILFFTIIRNFKAHKAQKQQP